MRYRQSHFIIALAALLVIGFLATSVTSYFITADSLEHRIAEESLPLTSDNIYSEIERDLLRSVLISSLMANDTFLRDWAIGGEQNPERMVRYLKQIEERYGTSTAFFVSDRTHRYYHPTGVLKSVAAGSPADAWYFRVRELQEPYEINVDFDTADRHRMSIFINYRVVDYSGRYIGATGIGLSVDSVTKLIEAYQNRYSRQIYFVDREGAVTLRGSRFDGATRIRNRPGLGAFSTRILTNPSAAVAYEGADGAKVYVNSRLVPELNWYLVVEQAESATESRIRNTLLANIGVALAITALVLTIAWFTLRRQQRRLEQMATTDKLTGAANRHVFELIFTHDIKAAARRGDAISLITIDLDRFKIINDTFGHEGGDAVLRKFAEIVRDHIRDADTFCRWGGDEFVILMGACRADQAAGTAERIREAIRRHPFRSGNTEIPVTISIGIAQHQVGEDLSALMKRADAALYASKERGRDRVTAV